MNSLLQARALEQNAFEVLRLARSQRNGLAPINRIPPEVLALIPKYWNEDVRDRATVALTHVCQAWRDIFISNSTLWTNFDCEEIDKTLVYLHRSGSSPINVRLKRDEGLSPYDPFLQIIPQVAPRLKSVAIHGTSENIQEITAQLSYPTPLLESLTIETNAESSPQRGPVITAKLFNGDLSSLRELHLRSIRTELPWRNMVNLTSFTLTYTAFSASPVGYLLDFFKTTPRLREVQLHYAAPTFGTQKGRLVSLACLKRMDITGGAPSLLLDHLLVPVGTKLSGTFPLPKSIGFSTLSRFRIHLHVRGPYPSIRFGGPHGNISIAPTTPHATTTCRVLESLAQYHKSHVERLRLAGGDLMRQDGCDFDPVLSSMTDLRSITISRCKTVSCFVTFLMSSDLCPNLEELILDPRADAGVFDIQAVTELAEKRALRGTKLKSVRIVSRDKTVQAGAVKLKEYVSHVECSPMVALASEYIDSGDEED